MEHLLSKSNAPDLPTPTAFQSVLFENGGYDFEALESPDFFRDLNLDQVIGAITAKREEYHLKPFFYHSRKEVHAIQYRQEVMRDMENDAVFGAISAFSSKMVEARRYRNLVGRLYFKYHKEGWLLEAVDSYCKAIVDLARDLAGLSLKSRGLLAFREYLAAYTNSSRFTALLDETKNVKADLSTITYCLIIKGNSVTVRKYESETDYSIDVEKVFQKFKAGAAKDYHAKLPVSSGMNHVEAQAVEAVARLYPEIFRKLEDYCERNRSYLDETILDFEREIQFYVAYLEYLAKFKECGLPFCYPEISDKEKSVLGCDAFDLALANKLAAKKSSIVCNDFYLKDEERIFVVSGPNQGGKTTFARMFGQLHYLASVGCPVPGTKARLFLFDNLFTHFEKEESLKTLRGKLEDDLLRLAEILERATSNSIILLNEIFTSTTLEDALLLGNKILERIIQLDLLCVCVTFIDEWSRLSPKTVSVVSTVIPDNPKLRTYKIIRKPADGLSYAISIAEKYHLTYRQLKGRLKS